MDPPGVPPPCPRRPEPRPWWRRAPRANRYWSPVRRSPKKPPSHFEPFSAKYYHNPQAHMLFCHTNVEASSKS